MRGEVFVRVSARASVLCDNMEGASMSTNPRTVDEVFKDFKGRRSGMLKALTTGRSIAVILLFRGRCF